MSQVEEIIYIKAFRKNIPTFLARWEGQLYDAPMRWWKDVTNTEVGCMSARYKERREGRRDYTNEQILGIDPINYSPTDNLPSINKKSLKEIHDEMIDPMSLFIRGKIGWDRTKFLSDER